MLSPLIITSEPLPTTMAVCSDLIAVHVSSKEYHSVRAHNPWDDQARIIASSPNLLLATTELLPATTTNLMCYPQEHSLPY